VRQRRRDADILITPAVGDVAMMDFTQKKRLMQAGMLAAQQAMPAIRQALEDWSAKRGRVAVR
jgi:predicted acylesterase/phospholipase RssA